MILTDFIKENEKRTSALIEEMMSILRNELKELGGEFTLTINPYGFVTAWLEGDDNEEVWWDKDDSAFQMDELTELSALHETIMKTAKEIDEQN